MSVLALSDTASDRAQRYRLAGALAISIVLHALASILMPPMQPEIAPPPRTLEVLLLEKPAPPAVETEVRAKPPPPASTRRKASAPTA